MAGKSRPPLDAPTLTKAAAYVTRRQLLVSSDSWDIGFNAGIKAAARHLRQLATEARRRSQKGGGT
jgi:hypothetical protein